MRKNRPIIILVSAAIIFSGFTAVKKNTGDWTPLFNGRDLSGWDTYLGPLFDESGKQVSDVPIGLNTDPKKVFSIVQDDGENIIRISGENFGGISTTKTYHDYYLKLMFKWGTKRWAPKKDKKRDSGVLYHCIGPMGADFGFWMRSQEFQVEEGNCGDYWGVAGGMEDVPATKKSDSEYVYNPAGTMYTFSANSKTGRRCMKRADAEKPSGEWNTLELYTHGDTSVHVINGKPVMVLYHSGQWENGREIPLTSGKIQIQSEGAEIYYKQIMITPLNAIPKSMLQ